MQHSTACQRRQPASLGIGGLHAGPRLGKGGLGVSEAIVHLDHVGAIVGVEHLRADEVVFDQATGDGVAIRRAAPVDVDVGLDGKPLPGPKLGSAPLADAHHRHRRLVAKPCRVMGKVAPVQLRVVATKANELHVREAEANRVDAHQDLIGPDGRDVDQLRQPVPTQALDAGTVEVPGQRSCGNRSAALR